MLVIADATPLHYLILIGEINLLHDLYDTVLVPNGVLAELSHPRTPSRVRERVGALPPWVNVVQSKTFELPFQALGLGEREAIAIARRDEASILLTDDSRAREAAATVGTQTIPILSTAGDLGMVDFRDALRRLGQTNFRVSRKLIEGLMKQQPTKEGLNLDLRSR